MANEDISDELNKLIKRNAKGEIESIPDSQKVMNETQKQFQPPTPHIETREEYQKKDEEYTQRIEKAQTAEEHNKLLLERTKHRTDRLTGKYKTQPQSNISSVPIASPSIIPLATPQQSNISSVPLAQPTQQPLIHNVIQTPEQVQLATPQQVQTTVSEPLVYQKEQLQSNKEYLWIPDKQGYVEYNANQKMNIENIITGKTETVTMKQLKYLYEPQSGGFVKEKNNIMIEHDTLQKTDNNLIPLMNQIVLDTDVTIFGHKFHLRGGSIVSHGYISVDNAREQARLSIRKKAIYMAQLIRAGMNEEDAYNVVKDYKHTDIKNIRGDEPLPPDVELNEEYNEEYREYITSNQTE